MSGLGPPTAAELAAARAKEAGAGGVLPKPCGLDELPGAVKQHVASES